METVTVSCPDDHTLVNIFQKHPNVRLLTERSDSVRFSRGTWSRELTLGVPAGDAFGLIEVMDNNPLVCADQASVPPPATTLALVALAPLYRAGLVLEPPIVQTNAPIQSGDSEAWWSELGMQGGVEFAYEERDLHGVFSAQAMAIVPTLNDWTTIDDLYSEAYGRSFYVLRDELNPWDAELVRSRPNAAYRTRLSPDDHQSLLTIQVMADKNGKCGACQIVHMFNVMCGFEECTGIPDKLHTVV